MSKTALVTGATGFVGRNLVELLGVRGWEVVATHRRGSRLEDLEGLPVRLVEADITDPVSLDRAFADIDTVFHVAGNTSLWRPERAAQDRVNVEGTRNVVDAALRTNVRRVVYTSSFVVFGFHDGTSEETSPRRGIDSRINYFSSKARVELEVRRGIDRGLEAIILNPANIIGPWDRANWSRMIAMVAQRRLPGVPAGVASFTHVREVAAAHVAAANQGEVGASYLLGGPATSFAELVACIGRVTGQPVPRKVAPTVLLKLLARLSLWLSYLTRREPELTPDGIAMVTGRLVCSSTRAMKDLGYRERALEEMIEDCYRWMLDAGLL